MPRGLLAHELFLAIAELPDNQEVTARFISGNGDVESLVVVGVDSSHARAEIIVDDPDGESTAEKLRVARDKLVSFWNEYFEDEIPLPACALNADLKKLLDDLFEILPEE